MIARMLLAAAALVACAAAGCTSDKARSVPAAPVRDRPNIILIVTDDARAEDFAIMPNVQSLLVRQGATLPNFFTNVSLCCPARATILRGQYSHNHGVLTNTAPDGGYAKFQERRLQESTVATWLHDAGYRTGLVGKYLNGYPDDGTAPSIDATIPPGWDEWDAYVRNPAQAEFDYQMNQNGAVVTYGHQPDEYGVDVIARKSVTFVEQSARSTQPFFLYVGPYAPHQDATPAPRHAALFADAVLPASEAIDEVDVADKPAYVAAMPRLNDTARAILNDLYRNRLRSLQSVDDMVGTIIDALQRTGQLESTYIFFTSDNGIELGEHRIAAKEVPYEESVRVSLIARGPGIPAATSLEGIAGNTDFAPTLAAIAGVVPPAFVDGRSLLPSLAGGGEPAGARHAFLLEHWHMAEDVIDVPPFAGVRTDHYKYVEYEATGERELYDLRRDPQELDNIAASADPLLVARLTSQLHRLQDCAGAACASIENEDVEAP